MSQYWSPSEEQKKEAIDHCIEASYKYAQNSTDRAVSPIPASLNDVTVDAVKTQLAAQQSDGRALKPELNSKVDALRKEADLSRQEGANNHDALKKSVVPVLQEMYGDSWKQSAQAKKEASLALAPQLDKLEKTEVSDSIQPVSYCMGGFGSGKKTTSNALKGCETSFDDPDLEDLRQLYQKPKIKPEFQASWVKSPMFQELRKGHPDFLESGLDADSLQKEDSFNHAKEQSFGFLRAGPFHNGMNVAMGWLAEQCPYVVNQRSESLAISPGQDANRENVINGLEKHRDGERGVKILSVATAPDEVAERVKKRNENSSSVNVGVDEAFNSAVGVVRDHRQFAEAAGHMVVVDGKTTRDAEPSVLATYKDAKWNVKDPKEYAGWIISGFKQPEGTIDLGALEQWIEKNSNVLEAGALIKSGQEFLAEESAEKISKANVIERFVWANNPSPEAQQDNKNLAQFTEKFSENHQLPTPAEALQTAQKELKSKQSSEEKTGFLGRYMASCIGDSSVSSGHER